MSIYSDKLKAVFQTLKNDLGQGFIATDIWSTSDSQPLVKNHGYNTHPEAVALFNEVTRILDKTLKGSEFPELGNYYLINLDNNHLAVVISVDNYQQFLLIDLSKTTMGILMSIALPNLIKSLAEAEISEGPSEPQTTGQRSTFREFLNALSKSIFDADFHLLTRSREDQDS